MRDIRNQIKPPEKIRRQGRREEGGRGMEEENKRKRDAQEKRKTIRERKKRNILIKRAIKGLARTIALGKFPGVHQDVLS